jgi:TRAP transporter TAXI family solute receptor
MPDRRSLLAGALLLPAVRAFAATKLNENWPTAILMATGRPGGAYTVYGPAWGALAEKASGVAIAYIASGGAATDILLIEQNAAQLGMTTVTVADQARSGTGGWTAGVKFEAFRALFPIFPSILQIVAPANSGIISLRDLANQRIGIGPDGGSGSAAVPAVLASVGITAAACLTGDYTWQISQMLAGNLDACGFIGAPPMPAIAAAAKLHRLEMIGFTLDEARQAARTIPGLAPMTLPAGTFQNQSVPVTSVGTANFAIGAASLPNALVGELTMAAMRNRAKLATFVPAVAAAPAPMLVDQGGMPFHPGAAVALRSLGLNVPDKFIEG